MSCYSDAQVLVEYRSKDPNHVEWAKAVKELYLPGLREYVKSFYPLGPVWGTAGKSIISAAPKPSPRAAPAAPAPPPPPPSSLFSADSSQPSSSAPKVGMSAVFQEINSGGVTSGSYPILFFLSVVLCLTCVLSDFDTCILVSYVLGLRKVTADMKSKNRSDRSGVVSASGKEPRASSAAFSKAGPPKLELQMGRK